MTYKGIFEEAMQLEKLKKRVKNLMEINKEHQMINGKLRSKHFEVINTVRGIYCLLENVTTKKK